MKTVQAFECTVCKNIYKTSKEASACLKACKKAEKLEAEEKLRQENLDYWRNYVRLNATSVQDIIDLSIKASKHLNPKAALKWMQLSVKYWQEASNSHSHPINGVSNWGNRDKDKPTGYPALFGQITFEYEKYHQSHDIFGSHYNYESIIGIYSGSGGSGGYSVTLWLDDFPLIKEKIEKELADKEAYYATVRGCESKFDETVKADPKISENLIEIQKLDEEVRALNAKIDGFRKENQTIRDEYWQPLKESLNTAYGLLAQEFIRVNPNG